MDFSWWYNLTDAQAQIISSILTGTGILLGAWIGLGLVGDQVKKAKQEIADEAKKQIEEMKGQLKVVEATATAGLQVAQRAEQEQEAEQEEEPIQEGAGVTQPAENNRSRATAVVKQAQDFVRDVANNDPDGRYKRTYDSIPPTYFDLLAKALRERGRFTQDQADQAQRIVSIWRKYQRGRAARKEVASEDLVAIQEAYRSMSQP
jgi:hypothetical protein